MISFPAATFRGRHFIGTLPIFALVLGVSISNAAGNKPAASTLGSDSIALAVGRDDRAATNLTVQTTGEARTRILECLAGRLSQASESSDLVSSSNYASYPLPTLAQPGWPNLPIISRMVLVPPTGDIKLIINRLESHIEAGGSVFVAPAQDGSIPLDEPGTPAPEWLAYNGFWPPEAVSVGRPAILRGNRVVQVTVSPVQCNRATGEWKFNEAVDFDLAYEGAGANEVSDPDRARPSSSINRLLNSLVVNPPTRDAPIHPESGSYLIIYPNVDGVLDAIQPLIEWRARRGWEVHTAEVNVRASTSDVKEIIQDAYDNWANPPEMVALVGDADGTIAIGAFSANDFGNTDLDYVLLEGDDFLADADIGRLSVSSVAELQRVVTKLVGYEADPYMDETNWYTAGMVCAGHQNSGISTVYVNKWVARELSNRGINDIHSWYWNNAFENQTVPQFFESEFARGVAFANYRGWIGIENTTPDMVIAYDEHRQYPVATILTCGSGDYVDNLGMNEAMFRSKGGGIGGVGLCTSSTHVQYNNIVDVGIYVGFLKDSLYHFGTAVNRGRYELYRTYGGHEDPDDPQVENYSKWCNLMGDPATHIWTGVPQGLIVAHENFVSLGGSKVTVNVSNAENEIPLENGVVCLYKSDDDFQAVLYTDSEGNAEFALPPRGLTAGNLMVTVTGHNLKPYLGNITIAREPYFLGAGSWAIQDNGDGIANPSETFDLAVNLVNFGEGVPEGGISVRAEAVSHKAKVISDPVQLAGAPGVGDSTVVTFQIRLGRSIPDGEPVLIALEADNGQDSWNSLAAFEVAAPKIAIDSLIYENGGFSPGEITRLDVELSNVGHSGISAFHAELWSETFAVAVVNDQSTYGALNPDDAGRVTGSMFRIRSHPMTVPGQEVVLKMAVESDDGFRDTTSYTFTIGSPVKTDPFGPDKYGYVCFDSGDEGWEFTPVYGWVEIDTNGDDVDFQGTDLRLSDNAEDADKSTAVDLPFPFQYYGQEFEQITICTNGWAAFGDWSEQADFRNRPIASGEGPDAQLCVFWDNLITGKILTYFDQEGGRFIVEWSGMSRLWGGNHSDETFELILYQQWVEPTLTRDGVIVYQYKTIDNTEGQDILKNDTPYATVGIGNLTDTDGLQYTYWNDYSPGAKPLEDGMAIKFTFATDFTVGTLAGRVTDVETGLPIAGAQIYTTRGFWGKTDSLGSYVIDDILARDGYSVTAWAQGYNDSTLSGDADTGFSIVQGEITRVNFALLHPEFNLDLQSFRFFMKPESSTTTGFNLSNDGNGPLAYTSRYRFFNQNGGEGAGRDEADETWDPLLTWNATFPTGDKRIQGIAFIRDHWILTGAANARGDTMWFYKFDHDGNYMERYPQPPTGKYGIYDIEYAEGSLFCATGDSCILRLDPDSFTVLSRWSTARILQTVKAITVSHQGRIYAANMTGPIKVFEVFDDTTAFEVARFNPNDPRNGDNLYKNGLAWFRDDPDGYCLYIMCKQVLNQPDISVFKMNPETGDIVYLTNLNMPAPLYKGDRGITITPKWSNRAWVFAAILSHPYGQMVNVFELAPNSSWMDYQTHTGNLNADESQFIRIDVTTADLDTGAYGVVIEFSHNADDGKTLVPVELQVAYYFDVAGTNNAVPSDYDLSQNYPNPFNSTSIIEYSLKQPGIARLEIVDVMGRTVGLLVGEFQPAGKYRVLVKAGELPAGIYFYRLEAGDFTVVRKMVVLK